MGNIGNQSVDPYQFVPAMSAANPNWVVDHDKPTTLQPPALVSNSFTWEKVSTWTSALIWDSSTTA